MANRYDPEAVEPKWREIWEQSGLYDFEPTSAKPKHYAVTMLPYPSGNLHIGHWYAMSPSDAHARFMRMRGYNVFFPMGFDAFGLPAENAAIKNKLDPRKWTYSNIAYMRNQLKSMGLMVDWKQEVITADPSFYRWNQWFFIQFFKRGVAYKKFSAVDWCPSCNTTLAREQVVGDERRCERCETLVTKRDLDQWYFKITDYADELLDFSGMDWPERIIAMQRNWIGRSEGAEVTFRSAQDDPITVFTTRPDTLWGASFMVLAPEHPLVATLTSPEQRAAVEAYVAEAVRKTEVERQSTDDEKPKTGVWIGAHAINPATGRPVPIWIADYVLMTYGTGAIMAVPGHDERDFAFATTFNLPITRVVAESVDGAAAPLEQAETAYAVAVNSGFIDGLPSAEAKERVIDWLEAEGIGKRTINYRLRDWLVSRQRYWGTPIPMVTCEQCGIVPLPYEQLPLLVPDDVDFKPTGESPLKLHPTWRFTTCPACGGPAERDTDTMDTFVDSAWYQCRYLTPQENNAPFDREIAQEWLPVDHYTGGREHAVMHLLYTRFWWKLMRDMGLVEADEPMRQLRNQGVILGEDGNKMSKSKGNVVDPDMLVAKYGADAVRTFLMFIGPWEQGGPWNSKGIEGPARFLDRVWRLAMDQPSSTAAPGDEVAVRRLTQRTIKKVGEDLARYSFNTAIAALMEYVNELMKA
ncbi:MAG: leucine--tRNA ligase, partial [Herpetosiphonaceae bacterium]|nr:leucine--tRNA ligase [Herpetosiphonaceae bacterium]